MSLDFNTGEIKDRKVHFPADEQGKMNDYLHALIWNLLAIDVGEITEKNVDEVWFRTDVWQRLIGCQFQQWHWFEHYTGNCNNMNMAEANGEWRQMPIERDHIVHAIGLHTNVYTSTRAAFVKKAMSHIDGTHKAQARERQRLLDNTAATAV